jgi:CRISPR/Cas system-associated exonuclease Cas4 (RecB family)
MAAGASIKEREEALDDERTPHLSHSRINRYLTCPAQYRFYYVEQLRPKVRGSGLVFGAVIHLALADLFKNGTDPVSSFLSRWEEVNGVELRYKERESWESLKEKGKKLIEHFLKNELPKIRAVRAVEKQFDLVIASLSLPFIGAVDLVAEINGGTVVIDFKTAASAYDDHEVVLSDQLTAYSLAEPEATKVAFCVFVKTKEPRIAWHFAERSADDQAEYVEKARLVSEDIAAGKFYKRPGKHCAYCDFLPLCMGDRKTASETLVKIG